MEVFEDANSFIEISETDAWVRDGLNVERTLSNWQKLPDNCGTDEAWRKLVDSDWDEANQIK